MTSDIRWQQRFSNYRQALAQLETFFEPPALNEREQQGLIKAFEHTFELGWNTLRDLLRSQGDATLLGSRDTIGDMSRVPAAATTAIPGISTARVEQLEKLWAHQPRLQAVWLFGSRAMERHQPGSDIDLCLVGSALSHSDRLRLMAAVDDLLLPWRVDLVLRQELPAELEAHVQRVGRCIWTVPTATWRT